MSELTVRSNPEFKAAEQEPSRKRVERDTSDEGDAKRAKTHLMTTRSQSQKV
ncbi:hypothetical protein N9Y92_03040 [Chlamydiales bacterium]|nr:hypothetical protein [Chlamydiales bacterium]